MNEHKTVEEGQEVLWISSVTIFIPIMFPCVLFPLLIEKMFLFKPMTVFFILKMCVFGETGIMVRMKTTVGAS